MEGKGKEQTMKSNSNKYKKLIEKVERESLICYVFYSAVTQKHLSLSFSLL